MAEIIHDAIFESKDFGIIFQELQLRRWNTIHIIFEISNLESNLKITLNWEKSLIIFQLKHEPINNHHQNRNFTLPITKLNGTSFHDLLVYFEENIESINHTEHRIWIFLDCTSQGYIPLMNSVFSGFKKEDGIIIVVICFHNFE